MSMPTHILGRFMRNTACGFAQEAFSQELLGRPSPPTGPPSIGGAAGAFGYHRLRAYLDRPPMLPGGHYAGPRPGVMGRPGGVG